MKQNTVILDLETYNHMLERLHNRKQTGQTETVSLPAKVNALASLVQGLLVQAMYLAEINLAVVGKVGNSALILQTKASDKSAAVTLNISTEGQIELVGGDAYFKSLGFQAIFKQDELPRLLAELRAWQSRLKPTPKSPRKGKKSKP